MEFKVALKIVNIKSRKCFADRVDFVSLILVCYPLFSEPCAEKSQDFKIVFHSADATLQTTMCGSGYHLEFASPCFDGRCLLHVI